MKLEIIRLLDILPAESWMPWTSDEATLIVTVPFYGTQRSRQFRLEGQQQNIILVNIKS